MNIKKIENRLNATSLIPMQGLKQDTRVAIVRNKSAYKNEISKFQQYVKEVYENLMPEGYKEKAEKFGLCTRNEAELSETEKKELEKLKKDAGYSECMDQYSKLESDFKVAQNKILEENDYEVSEVQYTDERLCDIASVLKSGEETEVNGKKVPNDAIFEYFIEALEL